MSESPQATAEDVLKEVDSYMNSADAQVVKSACAFADKAHQEQKRKSGEPYIVHPIQVAKILADLHMDADTVSAGFLHDVVEDTPVTLDDIKDHFGDNITMIVDGVTKLGKFRYKSHKELLAENHRKLLLAMCKDIRVMIVKLADRLNNMRTLKYLPTEKRKRIANETIEIYAPLADRLGIGAIKWELEDLSLRYLQPDAYYKIVHLMDTKRNYRVDYVQEAVDETKKELDQLKIPYDEVYGRPKHLYSIYHKMHTKHKQFNEIYDLFAIRVIVDSVKDCYAVLGAIHSNWKPLPGRFKDYIAMPKANMYQSLHTTVIGPEGRLLEIQIRTVQMHQIAEYGIAAHWAYKEGVSSDIEDGNDNNRLNWFKKIIELQEENKDASDFMDSVKGELFGDHVYAFTPKGEVLELPQGAGPLDMAYSIHTDVGNHTTGARVNGKIVPLDYKVQNGDIVSIMTSNAATPSTDWVKLVSTSKARHKIKQYFKNQDRDQAIEQGHKILEHDLMDEGYDYHEILTDKNLDKVRDKLHYSSFDNLFGAIGFGDLQTNGVINQLTAEKRDAAEKERQKEEQRELLENHQRFEQGNQKHSSTDGVIVEGVDNLLLHLSHCCAPIPGDKIVGYITQSHGVSVHRNDCHNVRNAVKNNQRIINVTWANDDNTHPTYKAALEIQGYNRDGFINDVLRSINGLNRDVISIEAKTDHDAKLVMVSVEVMVANLGQLEALIKRLKNIHNIYRITRPFK